MVSLFPVLESQRPHAYACVVVVDSTGKELYRAKKLINDNSGSWQAVELHIAIPSNIPLGKGLYAVAYVANESRMDVFFDDIEVAHTRVVIAQETHYYPFGLEIKPLAREGGNRWKYNAPEATAFACLMNGKAAG